MYERYSCVKHYDFNEVNITPHKDNDITFVGDEFDSFFESLPRMRRRGDVFRQEFRSSNEKDYNTNYGNLLWHLYKSHRMVVVERNEDKVSFKLFWGNRERKVGNVWFKVSLNVEYLTVNTRTGDVYYGYLRDYQKKRKYKRKVIKNYFLTEPLNVLKSIIKNLINGFYEASNEIVNEASSKFIEEICGNIDNSMSDDERLFKYYLDKKGIKYPNNFNLYRQVLFGPEIRKILKKCDNKIVDAFMMQKQYRGKVIKSALHNCDALTFETYDIVKTLFGEDKINQEKGFVLKVLNSNVYFHYENFTEFRELISDEELKRVFKVINMVFDDEISKYTFNDHIRMYCELKRYGETELKWMSDFETVGFREEHLDWTDKIQFYKKGFYKRRYPQNFYTQIESPIMGYYPVLLDDSHGYNDESSVQSNCVKTYIERASSIIISLRKGSVDSDVRATIEYVVEKDNDGNIKCNRVQSLGRFNGKLENEWDEVLFKLDEILLSYIKNNDFGPYKITKTFMNNTLKEFESEWNHYGRLEWKIK